MATELALSSEWLDMARHPRETVPASVPDRPLAASGACGQCGDETPPRRGRCRACGALRSVVEVRRHERRAAALAVIGDSWYEWIGEAVGVVVIVLVVCGLLPAWTLVIAAIGLFRPLSRLLMAAIRDAPDL